MRLPGTHRRHATRVAAVVSTLTIAAAALAGCGTDTGNQITLYYSPEQYVQGIIDRCNEEADGAYRIVHRTLPRDADGQREQMVRRLAAGDTDLDILGLDVTWVPEFAEAKWLAEWTGENRAEATRGVPESLLATAIWDDKLYAATMNTNVQLLWYDKSITPEPPKTWDEMMDMSRDLKQQGKPYQILFTGAQYEGLVVQYNTIVASAGGQILSEDGKEVVMDEGATRGLEILKQVSTSGLTHPSLSNAQEQQIQLAFEAADSQSAFELNWPYVYSAMQEGNPERAKNLGWTTYPGVNPGEPSKPTVGGFNMAVSANSEKKEQAFQAALCLRSEQSQKYAAICGGVPPTIESIYTDETPIEPCTADSSERPSMATAYPMRETILESLQTASVRPLTPVYQNMSTVMSKVLSPPSDIDPTATADRLRDELGDAIESKGILP